MPAPGGRPVDGGVVAVGLVADVSSGPALQEASGRPTTTAAAPPRSRLRREIRCDEGCSVMAGVLLTIGLAGRWLAPARSWRARPRQRSRPPRDWRWRRRSR